MRLMKQALVRFNGWILLAIIVLAVAGWITYSEVAETRACNNLRSEVIQASPHEAALDRLEEFYNQCRSSTSGCDLVEELIRHSEDQIQGRIQIVRFGDLCEP